MNKQEFREVKEKFEKETQRKKISKYLNYTSIIVAVIGTIITSTIPFSGDNSIFSGKESDKIENISKEILRLESKLNQSNIIINKLKKQTPNIEVKSVERIEIENVKSQLDNLNKIILDNPEKAISVPLLKIEIENQKEQNSKEIKSIKDDISRVYDMNKWIIGLVFTMLVSIIVLNISNLFAKNKKE